MILREAALLFQTQTGATALIAFAWIFLSSAMPPLEQSAAQVSGPEEAPVIEEASPAQEVPPAPAVAPQHPAEEARVLTLPPQPVEPVHTPWTQRGIFMTPSSTGNDDYRHRAMDRLREGGGNAFIFDVKGSAVHFDAKESPIADKLGLIKPWYSLKDIVAEMHDNGFYTIARYIAVKDYGLTDALPETHLDDPYTGMPLSPGWIDPADEDALAYNREIICEIAKSGIDEINLDYIRYDTRDGRLAVFSGEEKIERIETFITMAREAIDECGPSTKLGVSTFAILGWSYEKNVGGIGQDIVRFAPMLDVISPMAYNANFSLNAYGDPTGERGRWNYLVYRTIKGYQEELGPDHAWKVRPWLQGWGITTRDLQQQIEGVFDGGACGFLIWNANNAYEPFYNAMERIEVPDRCRIRKPQI